MQEPVVFQLSLTVGTQHLDELNHVNNVVYVQWVQDVAEAHWKHSAPSAVQSQYVWVVLRHEVDYKSAARLGDELTLKTWVATMDGVRSDRMVQIIRSGDQKILAEAKTTWCLLHASQQRPARIPDEIKLIFWRT